MFVARYADGKWVGQFGIGKADVNDAFKYVSITAIGKWTETVKGQENIKRHGDVVLVIPA